jgi:hypothetical protein
MTTPLYRQIIQNGVMISHAVSNVAPILWSSGTGHPAGPHAPASKQPKRVALQNGKFGAQQHDNASAGQTLARMIALGFRLDHRMVQTTKNMMPLPVWLQNKWLLRNAKIQVNLVGIGVPQPHRCIAQLIMVRGAQIAVIGVLNGKTENRQHRITMEMDFVAFKALSQRILNLLMITFQNIIIQLPLKTMGQHMKHGLR